MINERIEELKNRQAQLKLFIQFYNSYIELQKAIAVYKSIIVQSVENKKKPADLDGNVQRIISLRSKMLNLGEQCKAIGPNIFLEEIINNIDKYRQELEENNKEIAALLDKLYCVDVDLQENSNASGIPSSIFVGYKKTGSGISASVNPLNLTLKNNGNLFVNIDTIDFDDRVNRFISAFSIKLYKDFPIANVRIMLVDTEGKYRNYYRFANTFGGASEETRGQFRYFRDYEDYYEDYGNTVFERKNFPIPRVGETVFLISPGKQKRFSVVSIEYNYYERNKEYFYVNVYIKEIKE